MPDETTLCNFRHLLKEHGLNKLFFEAANRVMAASGHIIKGNQWRFGMKCHVGVNAGLKNTNPPSAAK